jgi:phospholipid/cholesterol/gamma-HCH transport system substrate-binding protein
VRTVRAGLVLGGVLAVVAAALLLLDDGDQRVKARFANAGLIIPGNRVEIAGRKVGHVGAVDLTRDGRAELDLVIEDGDVVPLREGTQARIRAVGQAGIANRIVELTPGAPDGATLDDGAVIETDRTSGIVDVDALLGSFGPREREAMRALIARSDEIYAGSGGPAFNRMLRALDPSLAEIGGFWSELAEDRAGLARLVRTADVAAGALARRPTDLTDAVDGTARAFTAVADRREALRASLARAPGVLRTATGTLARTRSAVDALRPTLREVPAAATPLAPFLANVTTTVPKARPLVADLRGQLPALDATLDGLRPLADPAVRALRTTGRALTDATPIFEGLRLYGSDTVIGLLSSIGGVPTGPYDAGGHYAKVEFVQNVQTALEGNLGSLLTIGDLVPGLLGAQTQKTRRCPGGNQPPAPDGSSPWLIGERLCSAEDNVSGSVNEP